MFTKQNKSLWLLTLSKPGLTWALDSCYFLGIKLKSISEAYLEDYRRKEKKMWRQHSNSTESIQWMITFIIMMGCHRSLPFFIYLCLIFFTYHLMIQFSLSCMGWLVNKVLIFYSSKKPKDIWHYSPGDAGIHAHSFLWANLFHLVLFLM